MSTSPPSSAQLLALRKMSSPALLSTLEASHSFPNAIPSCEPSHSLSSSSALASSPSLYVTFKVLQLVNSFRKRVKTRVHSSRHLKKETSTRVTEDFCQDFERQAFEEIDRYLGKTDTHSRKAVYPNRYRASVSASEVPPLKRRFSERSQVATASEQEEVPVSSQSIEWLLHELNKSVKSDGLALTTVAKNNQLFVKRKTALQIERLSLKELTQLLVVVKDLLDTLRRATSSHSKLKTLSEGNQLLDLSLDETNVANLEHLLLCLKDQLLRLLVAKLVELVHDHVAECQRDQHKHVKDWFFEFPDARHPLSTTWPWSIRPSLAVLWGVCWMFYDFPPFTFDQHGNMIDEQTGFMLLERQVFETYYNRQQQEGYIYSANNNPTGQVFHQQRSRGDPGAPRSIPDSHSSPNPEQIMTQPQPLHHGLSVATSHPQYPSVGAPDQAALASGNLAIHGTNNTYTAAPPAYAPSAPPVAGNNWLPQDTFTHNLGYQANAYQADSSGQWQQLGANAVPEQPDTSFGYSETLPPRSRNPSNPAIRVTTDFTDFPGLQQQPQDFVNSATSVSTNSSIHLEQLHESASAYYNNPYLSPQHTRFIPMPPDQQDMQTPPHSPHTPQALNGLPQFSRKRSHSVMSGGGPVHPHSAGGSNRSASISSLQPGQSGGEDEQSPRKTAIRRGEAPTNTEGKYVCTFSNECGDQTFDRKCEWSKHMDKHNRPYQCPHPSCAKLQGFTYSGGLLRHEREVHGKHGGPKAQLMCPHEDCKRHSGKGFTRKENLNEHIRRVHQNKDSQSQVMPLKREGTDAMAGAEEAETPASAFSEVAHHEEPISPFSKKRRERSASEDVDDLKREVKRLRSENIEKDNRLVQMEARLHEFEMTMRQLQQQGQGQV